MKRVIYALSTLTILLFIPHQVFALSCVRLPETRYFLECQNDICEGFKVQEEGAGSPCKYLPKMLDIEQDEANKIILYLLEVGKLERLNGRQQLIATMSYYCAEALRTTSEQTAQLCADYRDSYFAVELQSVTRSLTEWHKEVMQTVNSTRRGYFLSIYSLVAISSFFTALLPLGLDIYYGRHNHPKFLTITISFLAWHILSLMAVGFIAIFFIWPRIVMVTIVLAMIIEIFYLVWHRSLKASQTA